MDTQDRKPPWHDGAAYERYMGRWSRRLAPRLLDRLDLGPAQRWLDVGCGTGALAAAIVERAAPSAVTGVDPSPGFLAAARAGLPPDVDLLCAPADRLPLADGAVDAAVASLVLNFVAEPVAVLREMARVTSERGCVAACVWDYSGRMDLIQHYWQAVARLGLAGASAHRPEAFPICRPEALQGAFAEAGLGRVAVSALDLEMVFSDFDDYWQPFLGGQGPAPAHAMSLPAATREAVRDTLREHVPMRPDGGLVLGARAWVAQGVVSA